MVKLTACRPVPGVGRPALRLTGMVKCLRHIVLEVLWRVTGRRLWLWTAALACIKVRLQRSYELRGATYFS